MSWTFKNPSDFQSKYLLIYFNEEKTQTSVTDHHVDWTLTIDDKSFMLRANEFNLVQLPSNFKCVTLSAMIASFAFTVDGLDSPFILKDNIVCKNLSPALLVKFMSAEPPKQTFLDYNRLNRPDEEKSVTIDATDFEMAYSVDGNFYSINGNWLGNFETLAQGNCKVYTRTEKKKLCSLYSAHSTVEQASSPFWKFTCKTDFRTFYVNQKFKVFVNGEEILQKTAVKSKTKAKFHRVDLDKKPEEIVLQYNSFNKFKPLFEGDKFLNKSELMIGLKAPEEDKRQLFVEMQNKNGKFEYVQYSTNENLAKHFDLTTCTINSNKGAVKNFSTEELIEEPEAKIQ